MGIAEMPRVPGVPGFMCRARDLAYVGGNGSGEKQDRNRKYQHPSKHRIPSIAPGKIRIRSLNPGPYYGVKRRKRAILTHGSVVWSSNQAIC